MGIQPSYVREMKRAYPKEKVEPLLDNYDISAYPSEKRICCQMYHEGKSIFEICERLNRPQIEVAVLIMDQADKGKIKPRPSGLFGEGEI